MGNNIVRFTLQGVLSENVATLKGSQTTQLMHDMVVWSTLLEEQRPSADETIITMVTTLFKR